MGWLSTLTFVLIPSLALLILIFLLIKVIWGRGSSSVEEEFRKSKEAEDEIAIAVEALNRGGPVEYCRCLASIVRRYLGRKYGIDAESMSTGEIISKLLPDLSNRDTDYAGEILRMCEMVQFYRYKPSRSELKHLLQLTRELISERKDEG